MVGKKSGESLAGIVVGVLILSFVVLGIVNLLIFANNVTGKYEERNHIQVLSQNLNNIVKTIDTSGLSQNEIFYVHRNRANGSKYEIYTGIENENYRYINQHGDTIDPNTYQGNIYSQILWVSKEDTSVVEQNQVIRVSIKKLIKK